MGEKLSRWMRGGRLGRNLTFTLTMLSILSAISTYYVITHSTSPFGADPSLVLALAFVNLSLLLALLVVVSRRVFGLWAALRRGSAGSRLQTRVVVMFSLVAIVPAIIVSVFSVLFFNQGLTSWFDNKVQTALEESVLVAEAYTEEHRENLRRDAIAMANDLNSESYRLISNPQVFNNFVSRQTAMRSLTEAVVFQEGRAIARSSLGFSLAYQNLPPGVLAQADAGEVVLLTDDEDDRVRAMVKLEFFTDTYLLVERFVDPKVIHHIRATEDTVTGYHNLREQIAKLQVRFSLVFAVVVLLLVVVAIWYGLVFANDLVRPIGRLFHAAERVRAGDFTVRVDDSETQDEIGELGRAFNRMTGQLEAQRKELIDANRQLDERRRFSEAVLEGVSAGVVALDKEKNILLCNRPAMALLGLDLKKVRGTSLGKAVPVLEALLLEAEKNEDAGEVAQSNITVEQKEKQLTLHVRVSAERVEDDIRGYVVTFDDITQLMAAQRKAAWAGVARRIAHEIKNPLTPIQLSAERLKRKYYDRIDEGEEREAFGRYIDNIVRNVANIGKMAEEFATFARMPAPVFAEQDMSTLIEEAVFAQKGAHGTIAFEFTPPKKPVLASCDAGQIGQVLTNILKNATESIEERADLTEQGKISVTLRRKDDSCVISVEDNGKGLPEELISQLDEPYVTTKTRGTGLGLAIVKKIIEDHHGELIIENRGKRTNGARVTITLPVA